MNDSRQIHDLARYWADCTPDAPALHETGQTWTYAELWRQVEAAAAAFAALGLQPGQRILVVGENCIATVVLLLAASRSDLWVILANARQTGPELAELHRHSGAACRIFTAAMSEAAAGHARAAGAAPWEARTGPGITRVDDARAGAGETQPGGVMAGLAIALGAAPGADPSPEPMPADPGDRVVALLYTSGTTGKPKGVMLRQCGLLFVASRSAGVRGLRTDDRVCGVLPFSHVYGLSSVLLSTLHAGACLHVLARFTPAAVQHALQHERLTILQGVPTLFMRLLEAGQGRAPALRAIFSGGAPLDRSLKAAVEAALGLPLHNGYGLTEHSPSVCQTRLDAPVHDDAVGPPLPGVELRVVGVDGATLPVDCAGDLEVRSPAVMAGYYRAPELSRQVIDAEGWLATGDLARQAADGTVHLLGRSKEMIIRSGFKVYPQEVETVLQRQPGVRQAAVLGSLRSAGDGQRDEEVTAFVEWDAAEPFDPATLTAALRRELAPYKVPTRWIRVDAWPLTPAGKIRKAELLRTML